MSLQNIVILTMCCLKVLVERKKNIPPPKKKLYSRNTSVLRESLVQLGSGTLFKPRIFPHTKDIVLYISKGKQMLETRKLFSESSSRTTATQRFSLWVAYQVICAYPITDLIHPSIYFIYSFYNEKAQLRWFRITHRRRVILRTLALKNSSPANGHRTPCFKQDG